MSRSVVILVLGILPAARTASAQGDFTLYLHGGGLSVREKLNVAGTEYLQGGWAAGGGVRWRFEEGPPDLMLREDITWSQQELHTPRAGAGTSVHLWFVGTDFGCSCISSGRLVSEVFAGGGAVVIHPADSLGASRTTAFIRFGLTAAYGFGPRLQLYSQAIAVTYRISGFPSGSVLAPYHRRQIDLAIGAGVAMRL